MAERKIFNFKSEILPDATLARHGYHPDNLGNSSAKFVIATCRYCGLEMDIRKGFFNKSKSACHNACRHKEMSESASPFLQEEVREKARKTNLKKWGNEIAQKSDAVRSSISASKKDPEFQKQFKQTMIERYGVDNPCHIDGHMEKVRCSSMEKYGVSHFNMSKDVCKKRESTNMERYGVPNPAQNEDIKNKIKQAWHNIVIEDAEKYPMANLVNNSHELWDMIRNGSSLSFIADALQVDRVSLNKALLSDGVKEKYQKLYSYPKQQKQKVVYSYLIDMGLCDSVMNDTSMIGLELDMYCPSRKIAIEFNGSYWHSEAIIDQSSARNKHINKTRMCERKGIRLIHVFEKQWEEREKQFKSFIRSACGMNERRIGARECSLNFDAQYSFMEDIHIQGKPRGVEFWVNLIYSGEVVGSMSISNHHRQGRSGIEAVLSRMVFADNTTISGGASKMLKYAKTWARQNGFSKLITWSDSTITEGVAYEKMGFKLEKTYGPDYFYWDVKHDCYRSKQSQKKSATGCPSEMTERDWCLENSIYRIWNCGKKRWCIDL